MEFAYLVCAAGISFGVASVGQYLSASAARAPDEAFWSNAIWLTGGSGLALLAIIAAVG